LGEYKHLHPAVKLRGTVPMTPLPRKIPDMPAGNSESTVTVLQSTAVFFTVLTVALNRWYRPTLVVTALSEDTDDMVPNKR